MDMLGPACCAGFVESVVLAVKSCFYHRDIQEILIEKTDPRGNIVYHHRSCNKSIVEFGKKVSPACNHWFSSLSSTEAEAETEDNDISLENYEKLSISDEKEIKEVFNFKLQDPEWSDHKEKSVNSTDDEQMEAEQIQPKKRKLYTKQKKDVVYCSLEDCCNLSFSNTSEHRRHLKVVHDLPKRGRKPLLPAIELPEGETKCPECGKEFDNRVLLLRHIRRHVTTQQPCHICGQMVKELQVHIKIQHTEKDKLRYFCEYCGRGFKGYSGYTFHLAGHTGERKYPCITCLKNYRTSSEQKKCEKGHQGIYKYNCTQCSYRTHQKNKYVRHLRTHSKAEPFTCPLCHHSTARKDYLQKHIVKVHDSIPLDEVERLHPNLYQINEIIQIVEGELIVSNEEKRHQSLKQESLPLSILKELEETPQIYLVTEENQFDREKKLGFLPLKQDLGDRDQWKIIINSNQINQEEDS